MSLPVTAVTLFSSGVAHVERTGTVAAGDERVDLPFRTEQINDILKSMILLDAGGTARPAVYPSRDPLERTLQSFAVDLSHDTDRAGLLRQLRGAVIQVESVAGETHEGPLVAVESERRTEDGQVLVSTVATLLTDTGLVSLPLERVARLQIRDPRRERELREALGVLASGSDEARRVLTLTFSGAQERPVRVGYIVEAPLWKMTYRLVLGDDAPYLQGWALVENTSDEDWNDIRLSLVSGKPISFIQDLYEPLYLPRTVVPVDGDAGPRPQIHDAPIVAMSAPSMPLSDTGLEMQSLSEPRSKRLAGLRAGAAPPAPAEQVGELFRYEIAAPVSLPRQQAAMIPVVSADIGGEKLSLYDPDTDPRRPRNAVRLKNDTGLHLKAGPVTLFDDDMYAGDARLGEVPPGDSRLLTYALDLTVEAERVADPQGQIETTLAIRRGILTATRRRRRETSYRLRSRAPKAKTVLVEHPYASEWNLLSPIDPVERTHDRYRFALPLPPMDAATLVVVEDRTDTSMVALVDADTTALVQYAGTGKDIPAPIREAITVTLARRRKIQELESQADERDRERDAIHGEQERIRGNLGAVDKDSALTRRYLAELDAQETKLLELREAAARLRLDARAARDELRAFLDTLEVGP